MYQKIIATHSGRIFRAGDPHVIYQPKGPRVERAKKPGSPLLRFHIQLTRIDPSVLISNQISDDFLRAMTLAWDSERVCSPLPPYARNEMVEILAGSNTIVHTYLINEGETRATPENLVAFLIVRRLQITTNTIDVIRFEAVAREWQWCGLGEEQFNLLDSTIKGDTSMRNRYYAATLTNPCVAGALKRRGRLLAPDLRTGKIPGEYKRLMELIKNMATPPDASYEWETGIIRGELAGREGLCWKNRGAVPWDADPLVNAFFERVLFPGGIQVHRGDSSLFLFT